ncbi:MAG: hypothetical protein WCK86_24015 [Planctomycetia bacterium]
MKASQSSSAAVSKILSARWMLHLLDVAPGEANTKKLIRRGSETDAEEFDLAAKCRGYAEAIIFDHAVRSLLGSDKVIGTEKVKGEETLCRVRQALLGVHPPKSLNWKGLVPQLTHERDNPGAFARASLLMLELDALANVVEWAAVLTACVLQIGQGNLRVKSQRKRPATEPNMKTFGHRVVEWKHCVYAAFALSEFQTDLLQDSQWISGHDKLADDARKWKHYLTDSNSQLRKMPPGWALDQILRKRCSILTRKDTEDRLNWLAGPSATVNECLHLDATIVSEELRVVLENAHILPRPQGEQAAS